MIRHNTLLIPSFAAGICLLFVPGTRAGAQSTPVGGAPAATATSGAPPADIVKTMTQVSDLDLLVTMTPLNLNVSQIDKTVALLESVKSGGDDTAKLNYASLRSITDDVEKARAAALKGAAPDADVKARIKKALDAIDKRGADADAASAKRVMTFLEATLMPEQIKLIVSDYAGWVGGKITVPAKYKNDPDDQKAYVQQLALTEYAGRILLTQRAIDLLRLMRASAPAAPAAPAAAASTAAAAPPAGTTPPAPAVAPPAPATMP